MNLTHLNICVASLTLAIALSGCVSPGKYHHPRSSHPLTSSDDRVRLEFVRFSSPNHAQVRLTNGSRQAISWRSYGAADFRVRQHDLLGWREEDYSAMCGFGMTDHRLAPGRATDLEAGLPNRAASEVQVGLDYSGPRGAQDTMVWSPPFRTRP